jgi:iron complex transport system substrate-binding protein
VRLCSCGKECRLKTSLFNTACIVIGLSVCLSQVQAAEKSRIIIDMANRKVVVPPIINSVYATSPMGEVFMYTLNPEKIIGMTWTLDDEEKALLVHEYLKKPVLGGWFGKNTTGNPEVIIKAHPDIVVSMGYLDKTEITAAERIREKLGIPVIMVDARFDSLAASYRFLGKLLGEAPRADTLARFCRATLDTIRSLALGIPEKDKVRVYYAEGLNGLETDPKGSMHSEVLDMVGGINVAEVPMLRGYGRATVSFEQLLVWKPRVVLVCLDHGFAHGTENFSKITTDPSWHVLDAVKTGNFYCIPSLPFNWFDRPPSVNRILGLTWLMNLLYPDVYKIDIRKETRKFYSLFYHRDLSDAELDTVLKNALKK